MTAILANGDFPAEGTEAHRMLSCAGRVVACDGAAANFIKAFGRPPAAVVGDLDSLPPALLPALHGCEIAIVSEQETNDLEKAVRFCRERGWLPATIFGATGKREDHTIGNIFRALDCGQEIVTGYGRFTPVEGRASFKTKPGASFSVFATDPATRVKSQGLKWPLDNVRFANLHCATLNVACAGEVVLESTHRIYVYTAFENSGARQ